MNDAHCEMKAAHRPLTVSACGLAVALGLWALPGMAAPAHSSFDVTVNLKTEDAAPVTGLCTVLGPFADRVTVACSAANLRFQLVSRTDVLPGSEVGDAGTGVATSWRMVSIGNREYIEMTVRW